MAKVKEHQVESGRYGFLCPGCGDWHWIPTATEDLLFAPAKWGFNGDLQSPTFTPSLLVRSGHYVPNYKSQTCWCTYNKEQIEKGEEPADVECYICHSFIRNGNIEFLSDCTHKLAGKQIELPEIN